jgi:hypothetical protein
MTKKVTVSVTDEFYARMRKYSKYFNYSKIFQDAVQKKIFEKENYAKLVEESILYPHVDYLKWKNGDYSIIPSIFPNKLKDNIVEKAKRRPLRYFGEVFVAKHLSKEMKKGWYSSYKWLTAEKWTSSTANLSGIEKLFRKDLLSHFGENKVMEIQKKAISFYNNNKYLSKPVAPDLWLIDKTANSYFIEVKKSEKIEPRQLVGLALIKKYLNSRVAVIRLFPNTKRNPKLNDYTEEFFSLLEKI